MDVGAPELLIILVVALLIFGPSQLPKLSRSLGQAAREFRHHSTTGGPPPEAETPAVTPPSPPADES